ncbi:MAG TPA: hypothetical protein PKA53_01600 [Sphingobacterium sp.]|nr:hypothetical protein [Sphingobacterium sp.]
MKEYNFEYTDQRLLIRTSCISLILFFILITGSLSLVNHELSQVLGTVTSFAIPGIYFVTNEKKFKRRGLVLIGYDRILFNVSDRIHIIGLSNIIRCTIHHCQGTRLELVSRTGVSIKLTSNRHFCDTSELELACQAIEESIYLFNETESQLEAAIKRHT